MEKENKSVKLRLMSGLVAMTLASGTYFALKPANAFATGSKIVTSTPNTKYNNVNEHKIGEYYDETTGKTYYTIEVIKNDNASRISETAIAVYKKEKQIPKKDWDLFEDENSKITKSSFWPAIVYLNTEDKQKFSINPGDVLIVPTTYEEFKSLNGEIKASGWYSNYLAKNNIHLPRKVVELPKEVVRAYVQNIYNEIYPDANVYVDDDTLRAYLRAHRANGKYVFNKEADFNYNKQYAITDWIPSPEQLETFLTPEEKEKKKSR